MKDLIKENYLFINIAIAIIFLINLFITIRCIQLYGPQAEIMLHDYGQIFETIEDWKIWRIEHNV